MKLRKNRRETTSDHWNISKNNQSTSHLYQEQASNHDELKVKKKTWPPDSFFFTPHLVRFLAPRGSATQLVQPNGAPWIISNPIPLYRFEQRPWFFREKKTILLGNFVVAGQLESGTRKRARHWSIQEPTIESRFHVFLFDFRIDRFNGRTWLRIAPSFARVVPLSRRISLSPYFFFFFSFFQRIGISREREKYATVR